MKNLNSTSEIDFEKGYLGKFLDYFIFKTIISFPSKVYRCFNSSLPLS